MADNASGLGNTTTNINLTTSFFLDFSHITERIFVITHVTTNVILSLAGMCSILLLLAKSSRRYQAEKRLRGIGATEGQILLAGIFFCSIYLPCMTVAILGGEFVYDSFLCSTLAWLYGTIHAVTLMMNTCLSVCWLVRVLWPNINLRTHLPSLYITLVVMWIIPALTFGIHTFLQVYQNSMTTSMFCMNDLNFAVYLPGVVLPLALIAIVCYSICFVATREWKNLQYDVSPRIVGIVVMSDRDLNAMHSHCTAFFMFIFMYIVWRSMCILYPDGDQYTPIILHTSMILTPLVSATSNYKCHNCFYGPITKCFTMMCRRKEETEAGNPPSYADIMANQPVDGASDERPIESTVSVPEIHIEQASDAAIEFDQQETTIVDESNTPISDPPTIIEFTVGAQPTPSSTFIINQSINAVINESYQGDETDQSETRLQNATSHSEPSTSNQEQQSVYVPQNEPSTSGSERQYSNERGTVTWTPAVEERY